jgi:hypothetical protein
MKSTVHLLNQYVKFQASCTKIYKRLRTIKEISIPSAICRAIGILRSLFFEIQAIKRNGSG